LTLDDLGIDDISSLGLAHRVDTNRPFDFDGIRLAR
jgi:hypothetical protein